MTVREIAERFEDLESRLERLELGRPVFVGLTLKPGGMAPSMKVSVEVGQITVVRAGRYASWPTKVILKGGGELPVQETCEEVLQAIRESKVFLGR